MYLSFYKNKNIAIPGGKGFFGSHIADRLKDEDIEPALAGLDDGYDFKKYDECARFYREAKPNIVINCAANQGGIGWHSGRQNELFEDNMAMGMNLMKAAQEAGVEKFVNIVAGCAYPGYLEKDILHEYDFFNGIPHESIFSYGFPRRASVVYGKALKMAKSFNSIHLVYANMYGPRETFHPQKSKALAGLLRKFYEAKRDNLPRVEIWGSGKPMRDWLYVKDGVEGVLRATAGYDSIEPLNIATGVGVSVRELAETIRDIVGYTGELFYNTEKPDGALLKTFGADKMKKVLNWEPGTAIEQGIRETLDWLNENYHWAASH